MLNISPFNMLCVVLNLLILAALMKKFLYKPVLGIIAKRQELIDSQFAAAEAAKEADKLAFGVDSDQAGLNPDLAPYIPTSALKNVGAGLSRAIKLDMQGKLPYGEAETLGFKENGVQLLKDAHYEEMVPEDIRAQIDEIEEKISNGEIEVVTSANMTTDEIEDLKASVAGK